VAEARPVRLPAQSGGRRTHAERTAETRARVIEAVFESIADVGFARTTASEITGRAGVTWGAVQHHFGGKDGLLVAVVEDSFDRFAARLEGIPVGDVPLSQRASLFIDRAWEHFSSREYRSTFEILLNYLGREDVMQDVPTWQGSMFQAWDGIWMRLFRDAGISRRRHQVLEHYVISTLSGMASTLVLEGASATLRSEELEMLKRALLRELEG
jgi:AcrR family transcriptional regulator